jgi:plasmid maintenance system antidote protein VapI
MEGRGWRAKTRRFFLHFLIYLPSQESWSFSIQGLTTLAQYLLLDQDYIQEELMSNTISAGQTYNPNQLLDALLKNMQLKNDAALSRLLEVAPPVISKIRHHRLPVSASVLLRMHETTGMSINDLRFLMGDRRNKYRLSDAQGRPKMRDSAEAGAQPQQ